MINQELLFLNTPKEKKKKKNWEKKEKEEKVAQHQIKIFQIDATMN